MCGQEKVSVGHLERRGTAWEVERSVFVDSV